MGDVVTLNVETTLDIPPEKILNAALAADLQMVVVIGIDAEGREYYASSSANSPDNVWLVERFKLFLLSEACKDG